MRSSAALFVALAALLLGACADQTAILVNISSTDLAVPADVDGLDIRAFTPDGLMFERQYPIRSAWPQSLLIRPAPGEALGEVRVSVTATLGGAFRVRRVATTAFVAGQVRHVDVVLARDCLNVMCPSDVDCVAGACVGTPTGDAGVDAGGADGGPVDAGNDAAIVLDDAGMLDGGGLDAGMLDAGGMDAGVDAGRDASMQPDAFTPDVGTDAAGGDAGTDAATGMCSGRTCVRISEVAAHGASAFDEFVELYNPSATPADIGGCLVNYYSSSGTMAPRATLPAGATIPGHGHYLLGAMMYAGTVTPDLASAWTTGIADSASISFDCPGVTGHIDLLGYGTSASVREGSATASITSSNTTASFERKALADSTAATMAAGGRDELAGNGYDTDDNGADFVVRATRDPQSTASAPEP
ncbi:MAG: lamin tail domain-containing protein [Sandaracinus sp.]